MVKNEKMNVSIIGATGMVGQQFVEALDGHPWFEIVSLHGNSSAGYKFGEKRRGFTTHNTSDEILNMKIEKISAVDSNNIDLVFSAVTGKVAEKVEGEIAIQKPVISTASFYRYDDDVPIFLPIINAEHYKLLDIQKKARGWKGFILPGPNPATVGLAISTYPIFKKFGIKSVHMVSMQGISGGGGAMGEYAYDITSNIIPNIKDDETKVVKEVKKIFGVMEGEQITVPDFLIDAKCNRVPIIDGYLENIFIQTIKKASLDEVKETLQEFKGSLNELDLPNAPKPCIKIFEDPYRPQPRIDLLDSSHGMTTCIGGIEESNFNNGLKLTVLSHNSELGAGRGGVLSAEFLKSQNYL